MSSENAAFIVRGVRLSSFFFLFYALYDFILKVSASVCRLSVCGFAFFLVPAFEVFSLQRRKPFFFRRVRRCLSLFHK
jgi:hypothetical protein